MMIVTAKRIVSMIRRKVEPPLRLLALLIMAVPEGLPMMLALVSSMNSGRLLAQNILVRHPDTIDKGNKA